MGGTIFLAYTIQKDKTIFKNKNHSRSVILGFHMSNQKKGFCTSPSLLYLSTPYRVPPWVDILRWLEVNLESIVKFCNFFSHFLIILKFCIVVCLFYILCREHPR